jgi:hypothetical protein
VRSRLRAVLAGLVLVPAVAYAAQPPATPASATCPPRSQALKGVYHPERLTIVDHCRYASGKVVAVRDENDGDLHIEVKLNPRYKKLLSPGNFDSYYRLVVEFMARDAGHLPRPYPGDRIRMVGAWVHDTEHGNWSEFHPVWRVSLNGGRWRRSGPQFGGSPPEARSRNAEGLCRDEKGRECAGY